MKKLYKIRFPGNSEHIRPTKSYIGRLFPVLNPEIRKWLNKRLGNETHGHRPRYSKDFTWHFNFYRIDVTRERTSYIKDGFEIWIKDPKVAMEFKLRWT